jgi:hypothetical protein
LLHPVFGAECQVDGWRGRQDLHDGWFLDEGERQDDGTGSGNLKSVGGGSIFRPSGRGWQGPYTRDRYLSVSA